MCVCVRVCVCVCVCVCAGVVCTLGTVLVIFHEKDLYIVKLLIIFFNCTCN